MPSASDSRYAIPGFISILVVLGILAVGNQSFEPLRPTAEEKVDYSESTYNRIEARLWQDPFNAVEAYDASESASIESSSFDLQTVEIFFRVWLAQVDSVESGDAALARSYHRLLLDCIDAKLRDARPSSKTIDCEGTSLDTEALARWARANRSADLFARQVKGELDAQGASGKNLLLLPVALPVGDYADLIERRRRSRYAVIAALTQQGFLPNDSEHLRVLRSHTLRCPANGPCINQDIPYEYFSFKPLLAGKSQDEDNWTAMVLWLQDSSLDSTNRPAMEQLTAALEDALRRDSNDRVVHTYLLGPYASSSLPASNKAKAAKRPTDPGFIQVINWSATNRARLGPPQAIDSNQVPAIVHAISSDRELLSNLAAEVDHRLRGRLPLIWPDCDKTRPFVPDSSIQKDKTVLLISEGDTGYATYLNNCAKQMFSSLGYQVIQRAYIRGIDGQYPGHSPRKPEDPGTQNGNSRSVSASLLQSGYVETSAGTSQFDYLRRLAEGLGKEHRRIDAIGVLGSDPYDKVLVLQAMRSEYPRATYFTTDLYSLFLRDDSYSIYRNLLVAASHDLKPLETPEGIQGREWPPLRDSYQNALYEAASRATTTSLNGELIVKEQSAEARVFEIGRGQTFEIRQQPADSAVGEGSSGIRLAFWIVHLLALFCAAFVTAQQVITYQEAHNAVRPEGDHVARRALSIALTITAIAVFSVIAVLLTSIPTELGASLYREAETPSIAEQTVALALLILACAACLAYVAIRPTSLYRSEAQREDPANEAEAKPRDTQLRAVIAMTIVASFVLSYFTVWWLPLLLNGYVSDIWSLSQGVSAWPSAGISMLIIGLSFVAYYFIRTRTLFLADDLQAQFGLGNDTGGAGEDSVLEELRRFYRTLLADARLTLQDRGMYFAHVAVLLLAFLLISLVDGDGSLLFSLALRGGAGSIDPVQLTLVTVVALFSVSLYLVGRRARKMLEEVRFQETQRAEENIQKDNRTLEKLSRGSEQLQAIIAKGAWPDGPLTPHARAYFEHAQSPKARFRQQRFSHAVKNALVDIEVVETITKQVQRLFYLPVIILVLFAVAALPLFDPWPVSRPVLIFGGLVTTALVLQAWRLDFTARSVQKNLIDVLEARMASLAHSTRSGDHTTAVISMLEYAIHTIRSEHEGAFLPLTALPLVRILILTVGALGLILSQAIFGIGYSL